jgi:hypothetical protein
MTFFPVWEITTVGPGLFKVEQGKPSAEMRPKAVARALGVSVHSIYRWIEEGIIREEEYRRPGTGRIVWVCASAVARLRDQKCV